MSGKKIDCSLLKWEDTSRPLHLCFRKRIMELIADGQVQVGDMLPSRNQIRKILGISSTPYHKAINELIHDGILSSVHGKGVFVNSRHGRHVPEHLITLLVSEPETLEHIAFTEVINGILDEIVHRDYCLKFIFFQPAVSTTEEITEKLRAMQCEGVIVPFCAQTRAEQLAGLCSLNIPAVFLGKSYPQLSPLTVITDSRQAISDYVASIGKKEISIAYVGQPVEKFYDLHASWFRSACERSGIRLKALEHFTCDFTQKDGAAATAKLIAAGLQPDIIVAEDDYVAHGVLSVLAHRKKKLHLVVIGGFLKHLYPLNEYPVIDLNYRRIGRSAAHLLLSAISGKVKDAQISVESVFYHI